MKQTPKIGIVYLSFHCEPYIDNVVSALKKIQYPKDCLEFIIVDNLHPEYGSSVRYLEENVLPLSGTELPHTTILGQIKNLGFSAGNNVGIRSALEHGCDYVFLHNNDGFVSSDCLTLLVDALEQDRSIGAAQALMLFYPDTNFINSAGNAYQYLGVGYCNYFREPVAAVKLPEVFDSGYVSGAAVMLRANLLHQYGLWDEDFFMYHEDIEYSLRLKAVGYRTVVASKAIFYHEYSFSRNAQKFYFIERNRLGLLLTFYKIPTLILLLPIGIIWELGMVLFAAQNGWLTVKLKTYGYWIKPSSWRLWLGKRRRIQTMRTQSDKQLLKHAVSQVTFNEKSVAPPLLRYVANPLLTVYWWLLYKLIFW